MNYSEIYVVNKRNYLYLVNLLSMHFSNTSLSGGGSGGSCDGSTNSNDGTNTNDTCGGKSYD